MYALNLTLPIEKPKGTTIASKIALLQSERPVLAEYRDCGSGSRLSLQGRCADLFYCVIDKADCCMGKHGAHCGCVRRTRLVITVRGEKRFLILSYLISDIDA